LENDSINCYKKELKFIKYLEAKIKLFDRNDRYSYIVKFSQDDDMKVTVT
jgi:hypothetical protein